MESYVVIGGGIAGLTAANALAGHRKQVTLLEQFSHLGGRARSLTEKGYTLNFGPHALYRGGAAAKQFQKWRIPFSGGVPPANPHAYFLRDGQLHPLITNLGGLLGTRLFNLREKLEVSNLLLAFTTARATPEENMTEWLDRHISSTRVRQFALTVTRIATYAIDTDHLSAYAALKQIGSSLKDNVLYLDGGWQTLVNGLEHRARSLGVDIRCGVSVGSVDSIDATGVVLAVGPAQVEKLTGLQLPAGHPLHMASLDLGLRDMPANTTNVAFPLDRPLYFAAHSASAKLAPSGCRMVHVAKYLGSSSPDGKDVRAELEEYATLVMPGWRQHLEVERFLPNLTVSPMMPSLSNRPDVDCLNLKRVAIAGDWVGPEGMLSNAAVASALQAAAAILQNKAVAA